MEQDISSQNMPVYPKKIAWFRVTAYLVLVVAVLALVFHFVKPANSLGMTNGASNQLSQNSVSSVSSGNTKQINVTGTEYSFNPSTITVNQGDAVTLTFKNTGTFPHNLVISDLNVGTKTIMPGEQDTITFTASKPGQYTFLCTVPGHADRGMVGTLIVQ